MIFIIKGFWTIVFIFIFISTMFQLICPLAFFRCLSKKKFVPKIHSELSSRTHSVMVIGVGSLNF